MQPQPFIQYHCNIVHLFHQIPHAGVLVIKSRKSKYSECAHHTKRKYSEYAHHTQRVHAIYSEYSVYITPVNKVLPICCSTTHDEVTKAAKVLDDGIPSGSSAVPRLPCGTSRHTTPGRIAHLHRHAPSTNDSLSASSSSIICSRHQRPQRPHHLFQLLDRNAGQLDQV
jgi:hypothetical protein